jgi:hypothetical protein
MSTHRDRIEDFSHTMRKEAALFEMILAEEKLMTAAIRERKWEHLEKAIRTIDSMESDLKGIESDRESLFSELCRESGQGVDCNFYQWAVRLPPELRDEITETYRGLKTRAFAARAQGAAIANYLSESKSVLNGIMEELFPHRRGRIYDRRGGHREAEMTKVVLDQAF